MLAYEAEILEIKSKPLFFCGLYFVTAKIRTEYGAIWEKKLMFHTKEAAESCKAGDTLLV